MANKCENCDGQLDRYRAHVAKKIEAIESENEYLTSDAHREWLWWYKKQLREIDEFSKADQTKQDGADRNTAGEKETK